MLGNGTHSRKNAQQGPYSPQFRVLTCSGYLGLPLAFSWPVRGLYCVLLACSVSSGFYWPLGGLNRGSVNLSLFLVALQVVNKIANHRAFRVVYRME